MREWARLFAFQERYRSQHDLTRTEFVAALSLPTGCVIYLFGSASEVPRADEFSRALVQRLAQLRDREGPADQGPGPAASTESAGSDSESSPSSGEQRPLHVRTSSWSWGREDLGLPFLTPPRVGAARARRRREEAEAGARGPRPPGATLWP